MIHINRKWIGLNIEVSLVLYELLEWFFEMENVWSLPKLIGWLYFRGAFWIFNQDLFAIFLSLYVDLGPGVLHAKKILYPWYRNYTGPLFGSYYKRPKFQKAEKFILGRQLSLGQKYYQKIGTGRPSLAQFKPHPFFG